MFITLSAEVSVCPHLWMCLSTCSTPLQCNDGAVSSRAAKGESQSTAFPSIRVQLVWLSCDLTVATIGLGVKVQEMMGLFTKQTIQAGKTMRCNPNEQGTHTHSHTHPNMHHLHKSTYTKLITSFVRFFFLWLSKQHICCTVTNKQMLQFFFQLH